MWDDIPAGELGREERVDECRFAETGLAWEWGMHTKGGTSSATLSENKTGIAGRTDNHDSEVRTALRDDFVPLET